MDLEEPREFNIGGLVVRNLLQRAPGLWVGRLDVAGVPHRVACYRVEEVFATPDIRLQIPGTGESERDLEFLAFADAADWAGAFATVCIPGLEGSYCVFVSPCPVNLESYPSWRMS